MAVVLLGGLYACGTNDGNFETEVRNAVSRQISVYPESTLKDLYKSFFQDRFGPGHLISDTVSAGRYLQRELDSYSEITGEIAEPTGWQHRFYRVNLSVVKKGLVSSDVLLDALVRSANGVAPVPIGEWKEEWSRIESVIRSMDLSLPGYEADCLEIEEKLRGENYVGHHSDAYNKAYAPHYRIISREIFEEELLPLLDQDAVNRGVQD